jgi:hypothetical protein
MCCFVNTRFIRCFESVPNLVLCLAFVSFTNIGKFVSRVKSLVLNDLCDAS